MLDVSVSYNRYKFLGYEFLTWLWYFIENHREELQTIDAELQSLEIGNRIVLENKQNDTGESITIKGDDAGLEEGILALRKGAVVTEINLLFQYDDREWRFTVKGESMDIAALKPPETGPIEVKDDIEGAVIEKAYLYEKAILLMDAFFKHFIKNRLSPEWEEKTVPGVRQWIYS